MRSKYLWRPARDTLGRLSTRSQDGFIVTVRQTRLAGMRRIGLAAPDAISTLKSFWTHVSREYRLCIAMSSFEEASRPVLNEGDCPHSSHWGQRLIAAHCQHWPFLLGDRSTRARERKGRREFTENLSVRRPENILTV